MNDIAYPQSPSARRKARRFAMQALYQWQMTGDNVTDIEAQFRADNDLKKTDVNYMHDILCGVAGKQVELDDQFRPFLDRRIDELDQVERAILRLSVWELMERIDVPYRVVINEAIELAKTFGATDSHRYVNGVLDRVAQRVRKAEVAERAGRAGG